LDFVKKIKKY